MSGNDYKVPAFEPGDEKYDGDRRGSTIVQGRKMSRIGPPLDSLAVIAPVGNAEHSKLVEMEADNAIKYRTCSWQKVI